MLPIAASYGCRGVGTVLAIGRERAKKKAIRPVLKKMYNNLDTDVLRPGLHGRW